MNHDYLDLDAVGQAALVRGGELSARELLEATIGRIRELNARLNFLACDDFERALEAAGAGAHGGGPFAGLGLLVKDVVACRGVPFSLGSRLFAGHLPGEESLYMARLRGAGFIPLGKTTTSEFGLLGSTETLLHGPTLNPWHPGRSAAGSSGGAAAAVASRAVPLAHANDAGGSIRIPASVNGVFGLKPSRGRTAGSVVGPSALGPLICDGCLSLSVRDSAAFLAASERSDPDAPLAPVGNITGPVSRRLRIGTYTETLLGLPVKGEALAGLEHAARLLGELGHEVQEAGPPPVDGQAVSDGFFTLAGAMLDELARVMPLDGRTVEPFTLDLLAWYRGLPGGALEAAQAALEQAAAAVLDHQARHDLLLTPTTPLEPPPLGYLAPDLPLETLIRRTEMLAGYTPIHTFAGLPAMSVPLHWTGAGLPLGSHFAAGPGQEGLLLGLAYQLEEAAPWRDRRPPGCSEL